ncbi:PqqD family peptide modification chaperone [Oleisolibacter albus]|uniref:PqqD family peptide modification chaperone n=1 Tax=Oleisolibacter albus TaxID=2171757 RepID=UPI001EFED42C|nr:PqqD family peptide modification chaperone [Oleisolibacter albus]
MTADSIVALASGLLQTEIDGETVLLNAETGTYAALGATGSRIGALITSPMAVRDICARLGKMYDVDAATCLADVLTFLNSLEEAGLLAAPPVADA